MDVQNCVCKQIELSDRKFWLKIQTLISSLIAIAQRRNELARQRQQLREMDDHMLKDIGLSRADVSRISGQHWFWEDPLNRNEDLDQRYRTSDHNRQG